MTTCARTLEDLVKHLACQLDDLEGDTLERIAAKQGILPATCDGPDQADLTTGTADSLNLIRWSEEFLTSVINDGFRILALERPDLFMRELEGTLEGGCARQTAPAGCIKFGGITTANDKCDVIPLETSLGQVRTGNSFAGLGCSDSCAGGSCDDYEIESFAYDPTDPCHFYISPIPPEDCDIPFTAMCSGLPPCYNWPGDKDVEVGVQSGTCNAGLLDLYEPWLIEYAMYRAYMADRESAASFERSKEHWDKGMAIVEGARKSDYTYYHPDLYLIGPIAPGTGSGTAASNAILRQS